MNMMDIADPFARQLMARYLAHRNQDLSRMRSALSEKDFDTLRATGHNLHGSGGSYGLDEISEIGRKIEVAASSGDCARLESLVSQMHTFVQKLLQQSQHCHDF